MKLLQIVMDAVNMLRDILAVLSKKRSIVNGLILGIFIAIISGTLLFLIDGNIHSPADGIWSAWVTMTHVGFGDVVPTSFLGRILSSIIILFGLFLFSLLTATLSVILLNKNLDSWDQNVKQIESEESQILKEIAKLHERMSMLEKQLNNKTD